MSINFWHLTLPQANLTIRADDDRYASRTTRMSRRQVVQLNDGSLREGRLTFNATDYPMAQAIAARVKALGSDVFKIQIVIDGITQYATVRITGKMIQTIGTQMTQFDLPVQIIGPYQVLETDLSATSGETADSTAFFDKDGYFAKLTSTYIT